MTTFDALRKWDQIPRDEQRIRLEKALLKWEKITRPLIEAVEDSERLTAKDLDTWIGP